jgi:hypothetical protein
MSALSRAIFCPSRGDTYYTKPVAIPILRTAKASLTTATQRTRGSAFISFVTEYEEEQHDRNSP